MSTHPHLPSDQSLLASFWSDAWGEGLWAVGWRASLEGLTAKQASWSPPNAPGVGGGSGTRHSIWQNVLHMCFWREDCLRRLTDPAKPTDAAVAAGNFPVVSDTSEEAWTAVKARFAETQVAISNALITPEVDTSRLRYMVPHDCYHMGQINLIRAMLGLKAIE